MDKVRESLLAQAKVPRDLARYHLVQITKDQVASGGTTFRKGDVALADPDTYMISDVQHRAVYSTRLQAHQLLPVANVQPMLPKPEDQVKGGP